MSLPALYLKPNEDRRLRTGHLWIYSNEVDTRRCNLKDFNPGQTVQILDHHDKYIGSGYVNPNSLICARLLSRDPKHPPDQSLIVHRLNIALSLRQRFYDRPYYRLVFGESDGLPGLVVDRFDDVLVAQLTTAGMETMKTEIIAALQKVLKPRGILLRNDVSPRSLEGLSQVQEVIGEVPEVIRVLEGSCHFEVSLRQGQKTGWFYDQADNRLRLAPYVENMRVLDVFSYVGAWGIQAAAFGARSVTCVDSSATAQTLAQTNAKLNDVNIETITNDAFDVLASLRTQERRFDVVILDPPAFIKRRKDLQAGAQAYRRLNQLALPLIEPGGFLITGSCSFHMATGDLLAHVQAAARHVDRNLQLVEQGLQSRDHPVHPAMPETSYLKMFYMRVLR
jgi:23S rRNA (cytosine1962-C5)-methyltransferase